ncbi:dihydrodipicolinate synthase family protein [Novipirellula artificiosorum]|uniref:N-acetylneuraminate lyase n=1 Tax=Novipirellula artificiosorum TaxID=2528016 RepID=A0A5C6DTJ4_9BACT|nr:dihydrodipicolinate synthase family protein [Novipirellula artificiosorum]TWU39635.1 N-acetylneuraminate lyase [Novipirellula artificiosorum]
MTTTTLSGLIAATYTPLNDGGDVNLSAIPQMVDYLLSQGVSGLYVCGSTGEGMSLTSDERRAVASAYVEATAKHIPVIVQVGHNSVHEACQLAEHAQAIGADVISATCPSYFKVADVAMLVETMAEVAGGAPDLPFYYYHIPALTGSAIDMGEFLLKGGERIPNLAGLKYTDTKLFEFQHCLELQDGRFDVVWGCDEMLLGALATGARAGIGSTYNIAAPLYRRIIEAFNQGDIERARHWQSRSIEMIRAIGRYPFHPAMKAILEMRGLSVGGCRLPQGRLSMAETKSLRADLEAIGFNELQAANLPLAE